MSKSQRKQNRYELGERFIAAKAGQNLSSKGLCCRISHKRKVAKLVDGSFPKCGLVAVSVSALKRGQIGLFSLGIPNDFGMSKVKVRIRSPKNRKGDGNSY